MPWNQPGSGNNNNGSGNNNDRDPWGQKRGDQKPPDLDEIARKLQQRLGGLFGGGGNNGGSGGSDGGNQGNPFSGSGINRTGLIAIAAVLGVIWVLMGFYTVQDREKAVVLRFGKFLETNDSGLRWNPRFIDTVEKVDVQKLRSVEVGYRGSGQDRRSRVSSATKPDEALMLTKDENIIEVQLAVQYDIGNAADLLFNVQEAPINIDQIVRQATESAIREVVGDTDMDIAITEGRSALGAKAEALLQEILDRHETGINVRSVEMQGALPPPEVKDAFDDAVRAREDEETLKNEAEAYANDVVPRARGEASRIRQEAEGYREAVVAKATGEAQRFEQVFSEYKKAPDITRDRLYLESMEQVLSNSTKLLMDQKGGNNVMYLPLDQMLKSRPQASGTSAQPSNVQSPVTRPSSSTNSNSRQGRTQGRTLGRN